jgi:D-alanine-D-alanine ligase
MLPLTEVVSSNEFFDYEAKYTPGKAQEITPARVSDAIRDKVYAEARKVYSLMQMHGIVRIDFIIVGEKPYLMEVNTTPGMTQTSFIPQQIAASGRTMKEVFTTIIEN